jgi:hypothetical protein
MTQCISRTTSEDKRILFPDGIHYYYPEFQCSNIIYNSSSKYCSDCFIKLDYIKIQGSRKFDHGNIGEPITSKSHIIGGQWYLDHVKKYVSNETKEHAKLIKKELKEAKLREKENSIKNSKSNSPKSNDSLQSDMHGDESLSSNSSKPKKRIIKKIIKTHIPVTKRLITLSLDLSFHAFESTEDPLPVYGYEINKLTRQGEVYIDSDGVEIPAKDFE